jgi:hypothetical protein
MHPVGFEPTISAGEQPQTVLDRAATGTGIFIYIFTFIHEQSVCMNICVEPLSVVVLFFQTDNERYCLRVEYMCGDEGIFHAVDVRSVCALYIVTV